MEKVLVERLVEQVKEGVHYKGHIKVGDSNPPLSYELVLSISIPQLQGVEIEENYIREIFHITVRRDDVEIPLTEEEYFFFFVMTLNPVMTFYKSLLEGNSRGLKGRVIYRQSSIVHEFSPDECEMLNAPKFGCTLPS
jgi:hypothetical protein